MPVKGRGKRRREALRAVTWMPFLAIALAFGAGAFLALSLLGAWRWRRLTRDLRARLESARVASAAIRAADLATLPEPVRRYLGVALPAGARPIAAADIATEGTFNLSPTGESWVRFRSEQRVVTRRPGFVWNARMPVPPGVPVLVHDAYVAGEGILHPSLLGLLPLGAARGTPELAQGELMRWLAESAWYPTALAPGQGVRWEAVDARSARATVEDGTVTATLLFRFGDNGLPESVRAETRGRTVGGTVVPTPWEGRWMDYREVQGVRVPSRGEVAWITPEGRRPYWRGAVTAISLEFAR